MGDIAYADAGDAQIAYRVVDGDGPEDVVMVTGQFFPMEVLAEDRVAARFMDGLASLGRLVVFDKRGVGLSDPFPDWDRAPQEQWSEDLIAVIEAAGLTEPVVVSWDPYGAARAAAARRPDLIGHLVLVNPVSTVERLQQRFGDLTDHRDEELGALERAAFPSRADEPAFRAWLAKAGRLGASPATARDLWSHLLASSGTLTPDGLKPPTLVIHRRESMAPLVEVSEVVQAIPGANLVQVPGADIFPVAGDVDVIVAEIAAFVTGSATLPMPERMLGAVLFTDLVDSTRQAADAGDERWRSLLDSHDATIRRCVTGQGGRVIKYMGDGVLAVMPSASSALRATDTIKAMLTEQGHTIRAGIHVGDVDRRGDDVSGLAVIVAARIMDRASADEVLVSESVRVATVGSEFSFEELETVELKGVPGRWTVSRWVQSK